MNIAEIIRNGIPKVGEAYMSDNIRYDCSIPTAQKCQVIGYDVYYGKLMIHVVMDNFKTLKIEKCPLSKFLSMKLKRTTPFINEMSIKKTNLMEKNKFYLNPYGVLYTSSSDYSLTMNGICFTLTKQNIHLLIGDRQYEITDIREIKKILEKQRKYYDDMTCFSVCNNDVNDYFYKLMKISLNDLLDKYYIQSFSSFLMNKVLTYKLLEIVEKMSNNL